MLETITPQYDDFILRWNFGGNSSLISLNSNKKREMLISSEHWFADISDLFYFDNHKKLMGINISIPNINCRIKITSNFAGFCSLNLLNDKLFNVSPMKFRFFDPIKKILFLFNEENIQGEVSCYSLYKDFFIMAQDNKFIGYILNNPIKYLTDNEFGFMDDVTEPSAEEYFIFDCFFEYISDNKLEEFNDDMSKLVFYVNENLQKKLNSIKSDYRRNIFFQELNSLFEYYCG